MHLHTKTIRSLAAVVTLATLALAMTAGPALAIPGPGGGTGGSGGGGGAGGGTPPPPPAHNTVTFYGNSYLGDGHGQTGSGVLDRTTDTLYVTTQTTAGWCLFGWHGASQVLIDDKYGHMIWASGEFGPVGVDGGCFGTNVTNASYPAVSVPAAVIANAARIDVFNFWDPQWTGLTKVGAAVGSAVSTVWNFCSSNPNVCSAVAAAAFAAIAA